MTKLLIETLEEQGALRALLEHTTSVTDPIPHKENIFQNHSKNFPQIDLETRYRGTLLELEKTVQKV
jgi:hypothetical protein